MSSQLKQHPKQHVVFTTSNGAPVDNDINILTAGNPGPSLVQDFHTMDKLAHFNRERIPERVVHAKGAGAHGYFEVTNADLPKWCRAKLFNSVGKRTPVFARFSTVGGEKGSADSARDPRGFAVKFYTEEGNWDMVGNNTPIFFIREPQKFPDFIHTQKRNPQTNLKDPDAFWDFMGLTPESVHQFTILFSDRGTPKDFRHMDGFSSHTLKFVNDKYEPYFVKLHFKTESGIQNHTNAEAISLAGTDPDAATKDLFQAIERGDHPAWKVCIQLMKYDEAFNYRFDPFDVTKVLSHKDYPLIPIGRMVLDRNPENYFAEVEQAAFSPSHMVPGIEPSLDKMLQWRLLSYPDAHRYRLGTNYQQIPINCPMHVNNYQRDGPMCVEANGGKSTNYYPNSVNGTPAVDPSAHIHEYKVMGEVAKHQYKHPNNDYVQAGDLYRLMDSGAKTRLVENIVGHMSGVTRDDIKIRAIRCFYLADKEYGTRICEGLKLDVNKVIQTLPK
ncbi:hypothetical protein SAMD00019534_035840 [Acytostelium subglobosum LB1]|uniref:hypothetical protein n=1 Tax=Acytostelium subglobosum LB1 TaxID=1410327 RepID=UPI000644EED6|nr:hypothetical protein SAMD00019534_035840 [Acytostelium subglobosum LB1]GAM20409.1 hypothetical protein SAMD00019534_035840 [Acytostelium subglobosum LB1]|eukprot:XP_012759930.1 hypothetical protein SAMD00019534_035840 [Acytostelium subglobosum LB1]